MSTPRLCSQCHEPLDPMTRGDARYCSTRCRVAAYRVRHGRLEIPEEMRLRDRWIRHRNKRPVTVAGASASSTDPDTWSSFKSAQASAVGDGLGFVLNGDGIVCVDLDDCLDGERLAPWAERVLSRVPATYVEVSPSGRGLHVWGIGSVARGRIIETPDGGRLEIYGAGRYLTVTGHRFAGAPLSLARLHGFLAPFLH